MNTLITLHQQQPLYNKNPSSWDQRSQTLFSPTINILESTNLISWKLHAQAKGFGSKSTNNTSIKEKKNTPKIVSNQEKKDDDDDDKIPSIIFERMIRRILAYVGMPMATGFVLLQIYGLLKEKHLWNVPRWVTFITIFVTFGSSVLGVAYGSLSTSWDPEKQGSLLGFEEVKQNWVEIWKEEDGKK